MFDERPLQADPRPAGEPAASLTAAELRFGDCRWHRAAGSGPTAAHCTHPDVLPFAGAAGFTADAWCPSCTFFKARRTRRPDRD
jgi:hypothetical protein